MCKIPKDMGIPDCITYRLRKLYGGQEVVEPDMEKWTTSKLGKEYLKALYCHPAFLTSIQRTSCELTD